MMLRWSVRGDVREGGRLAGSECSEGSERPKTDPDGTTRLVATAMVDKSCSEPFRGERKGLLTE